jgi:hypothetical protein
VLPILIRAIASPAVVMREKHANWVIVNYWKSQIPEDYAADLVRRLKLIIKLIFCFDQFELVMMS